LKEQCHFWTSGRQQKTLQFEEGNMHRLISVPLSSSFHQFIQWLPTEHLPWARMHTKCWEYSVWTWSQLFFFFHGGTGVWTQGFVLARQVFYHLSHASLSSFFEVFFFLRVSLCSPSWPNSWSTSLNPWMLGLQLCATTCGQDSYC
jgi:hypothetical protein